ncbi:EARLY NODULIN-93 [Salix viminalis]|uniref:EARLY NODULIN-93 n=1 Tax=Salix viminalis TaxID=40686 RepID=A0A6N2L5V5_SALVM|nr:EARLY NODULIN-93 [Salix viminalis]
MQQDLASFISLTPFVNQPALICSLISYVRTMMSKNNVVAQSPLQRNSVASLDHKLAMAKRCSHEGVVAGAKAAALATIATAIPTLASARMLPWARANLNHTAQALIISTVAGAAYFIVADKTVLATARKNSFRSSPSSNREA